MRETVLWRKISRIIMIIAARLDISPEKALDIFYESRVYRLLKDSKYELQIMSDDYIVDELIMELQGMSNRTQKHEGTEVKK